MLLTLFVVTLGFDGNIEANDNVVAGSYIYTDSDNQEYLDDSETVETFTADEADIFNPCGTTNNSKRQVRTNMRRNKVHSNSMEGLFCNLNWACIVNIKDIYRHKNDIPIGLVSRDYVVLLRKFVI